MQSDKLFFWSRSPTRPVGKGAGEVVADPSSYAILAATNPAWRTVLSNFHECPFEFRGKRYRTIEHAFQATKIALVDPVKAHDFAIESGTELALGGGVAAQKQRKMVRLDADALARWNAMSGEIMASAAEAKYAVCDEARAILKATNHAELWHIVNRSKPVRFMHLERIRLTL